MGAHMYSDFVLKYSSTNLQKYIVDQELNHSNYIVHHI